MAIAKLVILALGNHHIGDDTQDQSAGNGGQGDLAEGDGQTADTGDQDHSSYEQVLAGAQVHLLDHLQAGNCDEAVQGDAHAAHDAVGDGGQEGNEGSEEGDQQAQNSSGGDGCHRGVSGDRHAAHRLAVGGVGAAAEDGAGEGADAVTQQGVVQAGLNQQVGADDGGQVLVVSDMLSEHNKGNRHIGNGHGCDECAVDLAEALQSAYNGELRDGEDLHVAEHGEVNDLQSHIAGSQADDGEDGCHHIACQDAQDEGDQLSHLLAVDGEEDNGKQGDQAADQSHIGAAGGNAVHQDLAGGQIAYSVAGQGEADDGDGGSDDHRGHQLVDPVNAHSLDHQCDDHIDQCGKGSTYDQACVAGGSRGCAAEGSEHGADEGKGRAQEDRAVAAGEELIDQGADTCAEQGGGLAHTVTDDAGHGDGSSQDRQDLLECKHQHLAKLRLVFDAINKIHCVSSDFLFHKDKMLFGRKKACLQGRLEIAGQRRPAAASISS